MKDETLLLDKISDEQVSFVTDFKNRRINCMLTLRQVEKDTGISNAYLSQLENGKIKNVSFNFAVKLHNYYIDKMK